MRNLPPGFRRRTERPPDGWERSNDAAYEIRCRTAGQARRGRATRDRPGRLCDRLLARGRAAGAVPAQPARPCRICRRRHQRGARHAGGPCRIYSRRFRAAWRAALPCPRAQLGRRHAVVEALSGHGGWRGLPCRRHRRHDRRRDDARGARRRRGDRHRMAADAGRRGCGKRRRARRAAALFRSAEQCRLRHAYRRQDGDGRGVREGRQGRANQGDQPAGRRQFHGAEGRGRRI